MHEAALSVLEDTGLKVNSGTALKLLEDYGCQVAKNKHIVKIPEHLVNEAIRMAPREFTLASGDSTRDIKVPAIERPAICTDGFAIGLWDFKSDTRRRSTIEDLAGLARLGCDGRARFLLADPDPAGCAAACANLQIVCDLARECWKTRPTRGAWVQDGESSNQSCQ